MTPPASHLLETLTRRRTVLDRLDADPIQKPALTERVDVSRQTVNRALRELETIGVAERVESGYRLTLFGRLAVGKYESLLAHYDWLCSVRDLLAYLPPECGFDDEAFVGAGITYADPPLPHEPIRELERLVGAAETVVGYSPVAFPQYISLFHRQATRTATEIELHLDASLVLWLRREYAGELHEALSEPNFSLFQLDGSFSPNMGVAVLDGTRVWIGVYDDSGNLRGTLTADTDRAVTWAHDFLGESRAAGRTVSLGSSGE